MKKDYRGVCLPLVRFTNAMQTKLDRNYQKGGWSTISQEWLLRRLRQETEELERAITEGKGVVEEAADVANFAMMIADNYTESKLKEKL